MMMMMEQDEEGGTEDCGELIIVLSDDEHTVETNAMNDLVAGQAEEEVQSVPMEAGEGTAREGAMGTDNNLSADQVAHAGNPAVPDQVTASATDCAFGKVKVVDDLSCQAQPEEAAASDLLASVASEASSEITPEPAIEATAAGSFVNRIDGTVNEEAAGVALKGASDDPSGQVSAVDDRSVQVCDKPVGEAAADHSNQLAAAVEHTTFVSTQVAAAVTSSFNVVDKLSSLDAEIAVPRKKQALITCSVCNNYQESAQRSRKFLFWETEAFCSIQCIEKYQQGTIGLECSHCKIQVAPGLRQKLVMRINNRPLQFCSIKCKQISELEQKWCHRCKLEVTEDSKRQRASPAVIMTKQGQKLVHFCSHQCMMEYKQSLPSELSGGPTELKALCASCDSYQRVHVELNTVSCSSSADDLSNEGGRTQHETEAKPTEATTTAEVNPNEAITTTTAANLNEVTTTNVANPMIPRSSDRHEMITKRHLICCESCLKSFLNRHGFASTQKCSVCSTLVPVSDDTELPFRSKTPYQVLSFCSASCKNASVVENRFQVECSKCKFVKKYSVDMIMRPGSGGESETTYFCSISCLIG